MSVVSFSDHAKQLERVGYLLSQLCEDERKASRPCVVFWCFLWFPVLYGISQCACEAFLSGEGLRLVDTYENVKTLFNHEEKQMVRLDEALSPLAIDHELKDLTGDFLDDIKDIISERRRQEALLHLQQCQSSAKQSVEQAGLALTKLVVQTAHLSPNQKEKLKTAKRCIRNVVLWKSFGCVNGCDAGNREELLRLFKA
jgi:hypothetical protein